MKKLHLRALDENLETWFYQIARKLFGNHKGYSVKTMNLVLEYTKVNHDSFIQFIEDREKLSITKVNELLSGQ